MTVNQEVKGTLAKLLATENLTVEHRKVTTASFDVNNRVLILPIWKTASNTVYDLLVGHEVGHALYTPNKPHDGDRGFVNVLEDVRIEKLMKRTYPGLRKSFFDGYHELNRDDFFGVNHEDLTKIPFIDRINLWFKGNANIRFSPEEQVWVDRAAKTETFDEVVQLAIDLYGRAEKIEDDKEDAESSDTAPSMGDLGDLRDMDVEWDMQPSEKGDEQQQQQQQISMDSDQPHAPVGTPEATPSSGQKGSEDSDFDETESITQTAFDQALETLIDDNAKEWKYLTLPEVKVEDYIVSHKEIHDDLKEHFFNPRQERVVTEEERAEFLDHMAQYNEYVVRKYNRFKKSANKEVNYLVKQFEMKKSADQYKRQATSKTGVINTNSLYKYKLTDDIFKRITTVPDGKNHGLVFHIDWSGSMTHVLLDTIKQTFNLVWFCRKAGIPFRVLAFQDVYFRAHSDDGYARFKAGDLYINDSFKMLELLSSQQNAKSLDESMKVIFMQVFAMGGYRVNSCQKYTLGGTPLAEAIMCTRQLVDKMKKVENVQKVNVVCLTDGEANPMSYISEEDRWNDGNIEKVTRSIAHACASVFFLRDKKTGYTRKIDTHPYCTTKEIVSFFREITDYNWIGIRLCSKGDLTRTLRYNDVQGVDYNVLDKTWKKERYFSISNACGFSEQIYMPDRNIGESSEEIEVKAKGEVATKAELQRAFKKHMGSKTSNKTVLNKFIEQIA
tara:strand:+ start:1401 stop:3578 length:2178 start_codon:yes stop_codon:yes gene_type:complete